MEWDENGGTFPPPARPGRIYCSKAIGMWFGEYSVLNSFGHLGKFDNLDDFDSPFEFQSKMKCRE